MALDATSASNRVCELQRASKFLREPCERIVEKHKLSRLFSSRLPLKSSQALLSRASRKLSVLPSSLSSSHVLFKQASLNDGKDKRIVRMQSGWPGTLEGQKEYTFNLDEYLVTLEKPIGIRFAQREDGKLYVEALAKGGNAENSRMVMLGDVLKKTSAVFGDDMWEAHDFSRVMYAIKTRSGPVSLVFERTAQALHTRGFAWQTAGKARVANWWPENRAPQRPEKIVDFSAEDFVESAEDVVESTSSWGSQPHEEELAVAIETQGSKSQVKPNQTATNSYGAEAFFTQREGGFPGPGFADFGPSGKQDGQGSGEPSMTSSWTDEEVYDEFYVGSNLVSQIDPVEEYNDAMKRAGWDLEYHHSLGMNYTEVLPELLLGSCLQTPADVQVLARQLVRSGIKPFLRIRTGQSLGMNYTEAPPELLLGSCMQTPADVQVLGRQLGVTAVLNLQQSSDQVNWGIDGDAINRAFREEGIRLVQHPIRDFDPRDLRHRLPVAVGALHRLLRRGHRVYVTCTAGLGRSPAVVIAFLHWHAQLSLDEAYSAIVKLRPSAPNRASIAGATWDLLSMVEEGRHKGDRSHPVRLVWNHGGRECLVVGEFGGGWSDPMAAVPIGGPRFALDLRLPPGKYRYKFIIDGQWRHAGDLPTELDEWGNINNVVHLGPNGVESGAGSTQTDIYGARSYGRMYWQPDHSAEKVLERPLTEEQRRRLTFAATRMAFSICPITYHPKMYY